MPTAAGLPQPKLSRGRFVSSARHGDTAIIAYTDEGLYEACGVRIAFTEREGGVSEGSFASLNLKSGLGDDDALVLQNQDLLRAAFGVPAAPLIVPCQVHEADIVAVEEASEAALAHAFEHAAAGADAVRVSCQNVAALLCFADCLPLILVAPSGAFTVVHCGWRGVVAHLARKSASNLAEAAQCAPADLNAYIGPYIHQDCFEVGAETAQTFVSEFDETVVEASQGALEPHFHADMGAAVRQDLSAAGLQPNRIADIDRCTSCHNNQFFSYRAQDGVCGRHGAFAIRFKE